MTEISPTNNLQNSSSTDSNEQNLSTGDPSSTITNIANNAIPTLLPESSNKLSQRNIKHEELPTGFVAKIVNWFVNTFSFFGFKIDSAEEKNNKILFENWKKELVPKKGFFTWISEKVLKKDFFHLIPEGGDPNKSMARLETRKNPEFVSVEGLAHGEKELNPEKELSDKETEIVCKNGEKVSIANTLNKDLTRGNYQLNGVKQESVEDFVKQMLSNGLSSEDIKNISYIFNQALLSPPAQYIGVNFPRVVTKADAFLVNLQLEVEKPPVIKGTITFELKAGPEDPNPKYMKVDILVTNPGSADPNLANVHYCLHPVTSKNPSESEKKKEAAEMYEGWKEECLSNATNSQTGTSSRLDKNVSEIRIGEKEILEKRDHRQNTSLDLTKPFFLTVSGGKDSNKYETVEMDDGKIVIVSSQFLADVKRGYPIGGTVFTIDDSPKNIVQKLRELGISDENIIFVTEHYNQSLLSNPGALLKKETGLIYRSDEFKLDLINEGGKIVVKGSLILQKAPEIGDSNDVTPEKDEEDFKPNYIKVDFFVTHLESNHTNLNNYHYYFHPVQDTPPEL